MTHHHSTFRNDQKTSWLTSFKLIQFLLYITFHLCILSRFQLCKSLAFSIKYLLVYFLFIVKQFDSDFSKAIKEYIIYAYKYLISHFPSLRLQQPNFLQERENSHWLEAFCSFYWNKALLIQLKIKLGLLFPIVHFQLPLFGNLVLCPTAQLSF